MKKVLAVVLSIGMLFSLGACGNNNNNGQSTGDVKTEDKAEAKKITKEKYEKMTADDLFKAVVKSKDSVTVDEYIELIETLQYVNITDDLELEKNITEDVLKKIKNEYDFDKKPKPREWVATLVTHEAPQVRGRAYANAYPLYSDDPNFVNEVKELMKTETEPYVIYYIIYNLATPSRVANDPEIAAYVQEMTKHENVKIQKLAASALEEANKAGE